MMMPNPSITKIGLRTEEEVSIFPSKLNAKTRDNESIPFPIRVDCPLLVRPRSDAKNIISFIISDLEKVYQLKRDSRRYFSLPDF